MLSRLIYYSKNHKTIGLDEIRNIYSKAQTDNSAIGITGMLFHNENYFFQVLEGERQKISSLYNKILSDSRHKDVTIVSMEDINVRCYGKWSMLYINEANIENEELLRFFPEKSFSPQNMTSENLKSFALTVKLKSFDK